MPDRLSKIAVHPSFSTSPTPSDAAFLQGGGEAGERLRATDWRDSPLGPPQHWPQALRGAVSLLLDSSAQICLFWGPELVALYNDAYSPAIGAHHPAALARPAREGWAGLWSTLEPLLREVQRTGVPFDSRNHLFRQNRGGFDEDTYFDVSYSPIRGADGQVDGVFCIVADQTRRIVDERRLNTLRVLSMQPRIETAEQAASGFVEVLAEENRADAPYALVYLLGRDGLLTLAASQGGTPDPALLSLRTDGETFSDPRLTMLARAMRTGIVESMSGSRFVLDPPAHAADRVVLLPLHAGRDTAGVLAIAKNRHLAPNADYRRFSELLAAQLSASLSAARLLADERHRAQALEQQVVAALAEREIAEARLRQSQKMEAIGKLTGGIAHDFNNLLQVVGGNLHLLSRDVAGNARAERRTANALAGVTRGAKLSAQLLAFSRRQPLEPKVVRIGRLIAGLDDMLRRSLGEGIEIGIAIAGGLWNTLIDPTQLENALLNLAINARDAMDNQGRLTIETGNVSLDDEYARHNAEVTAGEYVMLAITDTGSGMTPEIVDQVFEPFFSTKPQGKGTGLGLSMVYGFVKQSGGHIKIYSEPGHGTTVRLYLPRTLQAEDVVAETDTGPVQGGTETILVAEDNEGVRDTVVSMLVELGYRVLKAKDVPSALNVLDSGVRIDLLFTDVVMPGEMRGPDLARMARERVPGIAVLFTSGYTENAIMHGGRLDAGVELLSKPYSGEALARKLRQVLSARDAVHRSAADHAASSAAAEIDRPRALRLLLVEDEPLLCERNAALLAARGHSVLQAGSAEAAIELLERHEVDVLVTDLGLRGIGGLELAQLALHRSPGLRLVLATGEHGIDRLQGMPAHAVMLRTPYDEPALMAALAAAARVTGQDSPPA